MKADKIVFDYSKCSARLKALRTEKGLSHDSLSRQIEITKQSLINYESAAENDSGIGSRVTEYAGMSANNLVKLSKCFGVSTDYLLDRTDVKSIDPNVQAICQYTGLSESAVEHLHTCVEQLNPDNTYFDIVSYMLSNDDFYNAIAYLKRAKRVESDMTEKRKSDPDGFDKMQGFYEALNDIALMNNEKLQDVRLSLRQSIDFYKQRAVDCYKRLCDSMLKGDNE